MNIDDLTIGQVKELIALIGAGSGVESQKNGLNDMVGKKCIVRTYSAGVWFGEVEKKSGNEVILKNARRMWEWCAAKSISLSGVAVYGINAEKSKIAPAVTSVWLEAIELIPASLIAIKSIEGAEDVEAQ